MKFVGKRNRVFGRRAPHMATEQSREDPRAFSFLRMNHRPAKPRRSGITEIRGPYYTPMGKRYLEDVLETMGVYVDSLKFAGGSFSLMPAAALKEIIEVCHRYDVLVSTGGFFRVQRTPTASAGRSCDPAAAARSVPREPRSS